MKDVLRAFPEKPGSSLWICQNLIKATEYRCHLEEMTCTCDLFFHKRQCKKHLPYCLYRCKLYSGKRNDAYERFVEAALAAV